MVTKNQNVQRAVRAQQLLAVIALHKSEPVRAHKAFNEFCKEFGENIASGCFAVCKRFNILCAQEFARDLGQDILLKVYLQADKYDASRGSVLTWIGTIAKNEVLAYLKRSISHSFLDDISEQKSAAAELLAAQKNSLHDEGEQDEEHDLVFATEEEVDPLLLKLEKSMEKLSEREREVLRVTYLYTGNVPSEELDRIARDFSTPKRDIRQIRKRALDKLRGDLDSGEVAC